MVQGVMALIKYFIFVFNFLFWLTGLALIVLGSYLQYHNDYYVDLLGNRMLTVPVVLITSGCVISGMGFLGCWGSIRENNSILVTFAILLTLIAVAELIVISTAYLTRHALKDHVKKKLREGMKNYPRTTTANNIWDQVQTNFNCCGVDNDTDWGEYSYAYKDREALPHSCCIVDIPVKDEHVHVDDITITCHRQASNLRQEMLGIMYACCLGRSIRKEYIYFD